MTSAELQRKANELRRHVLRAVHHAGAGHIGGVLSAAEMFVALYFERLRIDPARPDWEDRDRFILSKGHCAIGLYTVMAMRGYFPIEELATFDALDSRLQGHPDMTKLPGLDMSTGSLGQGLSPGLGMALGARFLGKSFRTWVMLGDGEVQEGQIWEAAFVASRYGVDNLTAILDWNRLQQYGWATDAGYAATARRDPAESPRAKWESFGWHVTECDGHDVEDFLQACNRSRATKHKPCLILAHTVKGKGVSFMENDFAWHSKPMSDDDLRRALTEIDAADGIDGGACEQMRMPAAQRDAFGDTMVELCDVDPRVVLVDGDLANSTKSDKLARERPERFFMLGIAEQNLAGVAAGMATVGLKPWVCSFAAFVATRDLDQIRVVIAQPALNVRLAAHYSGILTGYTGKTHQVVNDIAIMRSMPNMSVVAPGDAVETRAAMLALNDHIGPVYLRLTRDPAPVIVPSDHSFVLGRALTLREGADLALIATGGQTARVLEAADQLAREGIACTVLHVPTIKPLDEAAIVAAARKCGRVLVCEEHSVIGGLGGAVAETLSSQHPTLVARLGLRDVDGESAPNADLIVKYRLSATHVADRARAMVKAS